MPYTVLSYDFPRDWDICYHLRLPDPLPVVNCQLQLSLVAQVSCFGGSRRVRVVVFSLCPLRADDMGHRPDLALELPWKRLRVHDGVNVGGRSETR